MVAYGINNLEKHCDTVNDLNVFPVPDGDTGTNMLMTMKNGLQALSDDGTLSGASQSFANGTVFGARGNSGVIISQFFKGVSEGFKGAPEADTALFSKALEEGCAYAYAAVANPVEGTMLTVLRESSAAVKGNLSQISTIDEGVSLFLHTARISLENTPNLLDILEKAGVVDSGGAGLVYVFEGIKRYLDGKPLEEIESKANAQYIDYSAFNRFTNFEYGYCTEMLIQLTAPEDEFDSNRFTEHLKKLGESIVTSFEQDKVKVHIHTHTPEKVLEFCHKFGEFLSLKIENMSVQHSQTIQKFLCAPPQDGNFAIVAVAPNESLQKMFSDMGADVSILSEEVPSSKDFIEAFEHISAKQIIVFPNNSNSILSAKQAASLQKQAKVTVIKCRSVAQCYSAMSVIDFDADIETVIGAINEVLDNIFEVDIVRAAQDRKFGETAIAKGEYFSMAGDEILETGNDFKSVVLNTVGKVLAEREYSVINAFYGQAGERYVDDVAAELQDTWSETEVCLIPTQDTIYDLILSFE